MKRTLTFILVLSACLMSMASAERQGKALSPADAPAAADFDFRSAPWPSPLKSGGRHILSVSGSAKQVRRAPGHAPSNLKGSILSSKSTTMGYGVYTVPQNDGMSFELIAPNVVAEYGGVKIGDVYYTAQLVDYYGNKLSRVQKWDMNAWEPLSDEFSNAFTILASDVAYDPVTGNVYGCYYNEDRLGFTFGIGDYDAKESEKICDLSVGWNALACTADGQLYAIDRNGLLLKVDKTTGATEIVADTGLTPQYRSSGAIDPYNGRFFYAVYSDTEAALYEINLETAAATWLCDFPDREEITGMWIDAPLAADEAPAPAQSLTASFPEGSLSGNVRFTVPDKLYNGTAASGTVNYKITANGTDVADGSAAPGEDVDETVTLTSPGNCEFAVTLSNVVGTGPAVAVSLFVGHGTPLMGDVALERNDEAFVLSWMPVTATSDGGYLDADAVEYVVTRYPGAVHVATTAQCAYTDAVAEPDVLTEYYYTVKAVANGRESQEVSTVHISVGCIVPPYAPDLSKDDDFAAFTVFDSNRDGVVWSSLIDGARLYNNANLAADDWLISPAIRLEAGKFYTVSFDVWGQTPTWKERIEVKWGAASSVEGMTETILEPTEIACNSFSKMAFSVDIAPKHDGKYYIGFHGISDADKFALYVNNFKVSAGFMADAPAGVSDFEVVPDAMGLSAAKIMLTAPVKSVSDVTLASIDSIEVKCGDRVVHTFRNPAPGAKLECSDTVEESGVYAYEAIVYVNGVGSAAVTASAFIGVNTPGKVTEVAVNETPGKGGEVTLSWRAPAVDKDGNAINQALIKYVVAVIDGNGEPQPVTDEPIETCSYTYQAVPAGEEQRLIEWAVFAVTEHGSSDAVSVMDFAGKAFEAPYKESFADGKLVHDLMVDIIEGSSEWGIVDDTRFADIRSVDGDNGFIQMTGFKNASSAIQTGKIAIPAENPGIVYYIYNTCQEESAADELDVEVNAGSGWVALSHLIVGELGGTPGWNRRFVSLADYSGKDIKVRMRVTTRAWSSMYLDNISIGTCAHNDISVLAIKAPARVQAGEKFTIKATIDNKGTDVAEPAAYELRLLRDGVVAESRSGKRLRPCNTLDVDFECVIGVMDDETSVYAVEVAMATDANPDDNKSGDISVSRILPLHPMVQNLSAHQSPEGISLVWDEPDTSAGSPQMIGESFESGDKFSVDRFGDWTFVDADGAETYPVSGVELPSQKMPMAFVVIDATHEGLNETWAAADGNKYIAAFCSRGVANDDWAISPLLYGGPQTVSFMAKTYSDKYGAEEFEFLYSTTGNDIDDFVKVGETVMVPFAWTEFSYDLPDGCRYFAIRCVSKDHFVFMLDNVRFYPSTGVRNVSLSGYNVYRDADKLNAGPIEEASFADKEAVAEHEYAVTAVYDLGESAPQKVSAAMSARRGVGAMEPTITVYAHHISIDGAEGLPIAVYDVSGKAVYNGVGTGHDIVAVAQGIYVVKVGTSATKVAIR